MKHVIIGTGAAGITAARTIRELDGSAEIVIISKDEYVHSRCMLHRYISHERDESSLSFTEPSFMETNRILWMNGRTAENILVDEQAVVLDDNTSVSYDRLLIATGANSFIPPVGQFLEASNVFGLRHLTDAQQIRSMADNADNILIVGSGLVGMDAAYAFLEQNKTVTIVEMADRILPIQLNQKAGGAYRKLFEQHGCRFMLGRQACETHMDDNGRIDSVTLDDGSSIDCDLIVVAAGVRPALECIKDTPITSDRFISVSETMETSCSGIYAAGDAAGMSGIWPNAMKQGQTAAYNMCGIPTVYEDRYAMKNTMNFYGLATLSLGRGTPLEGDIIEECEDSHNYKSAIIRNGCLDSILLQGTIDYSGIYQYIIKNEIDISSIPKSVFKLSFADFYDIDKDGKYHYQIRQA